MTITEWESFLGFEDLRCMPETVMSIVTGDKECRDRIYKEAIRLHNGDLSYDWFGALYEAELAQRRKNKQDFTPIEVSDICALIAGTNGIVHEPTAGNGGMLIRYWWSQLRKTYPWRYKPSQQLISCWELSDRSIPFLLFNMSIRGISGEVFHGDVLEDIAKAHYVLVNEYDDAMAFSDVIRDDSILSYRH